LFEKIGGARVVKIERRLLIETIYKNLQTHFNFYFIQYFIYFIQKFRGRFKILENLWQELCSQRFKRKNTRRRIIEFLRLRR